ncbi:nucleoside/nucleotide kinase family protein [Roseinatronobacter alkalisoli]|uniref:Nucleoside/nucleotide kinase family protein n=1 Tax=Roseinatronobacter alkalisoli TaxID=3028235 RepID=A0ABT5TA80_9RHOB|nr:nucleoside/nucleotide kinase family protein [Roseinatronobacter sp. HJB301]MDD7972023.1 nucleoside/nucleotide kinase family protein [Roseinatronobacter sp. HJB301]
MSDGQKLRLAELAGILAEAPGQRRLIALAGPPGSGKSTTAEKLCTMLARLGRSAAVLPMDGFHYDDAVLKARDLLPRKGAPETFDVAGLEHILARLRDNSAPEVAVPVFDRTIEVSRAGARIIPSTVDLLIVEGNYLLLDRAPWQALKTHFDTTVRIDTPMDILEQRLVQRWVSLGLPAEEVARKVGENDMLNCLIVTTETGPADYIIAT